MLSNRVYDILKWVSCVFLDAVGILYKALSSIWGLPLGEQVLMTCSAVSVFLGALIGISTKNYNELQKEKEILTTSEEPEE